MLVWYPFTIVYGIPAIGPLNTNICLKQNMGLVHKVANKYVNKCYESGYMCDYHTHKDELIQIGTITLWKCILSFNRTRNIQFSTYAYRSLHNSMYRYAFPKKPHVKCTRFNSVHENTLSSKKIKPEEVVDNNLWEEKLIFLKNKGYKMKKNYYVKYHLKSFHNASFY